MNFIRWLNREFLSFKPEISNLVDNYRYVSQGKIQNFSSTQKLCLLGQKYTGTWGVNIPL